jgi:nicotinate-nucleotide adenylyltransferase
VSSSAIRRRAAAGRPIRYLVPDKVAAYIEAHGLYGAPAVPEGAPA